MASDAWRFSDSESYSILLALCINASVGPFFACFERDLQLLFLSRFVNQMFDGGLVRKAFVSSKFACAVRSFFSLKRTKLHILVFGVCQQDVEQRVAIRVVAALLD